MRAPLSIDNVLARSERWGPAFSSPPRLVRALDGGFTNKCYLLENADGRWVLRLNNPGSTHLGIDRERELRVLCAAADAGVGPRVAYASPSEGILVSEFVDGTPVQPDMLTSERDVARLYSLFGTVHGITLDVTRIDYYVHAEHYFQLAMSMSLAIPHEVLSARRLIAAHKAELALTAENAVLCHHDLGPGNVLDHDGALLALDWEYASLGSAAFDYAALVVEWRRPAEEVAERFAITHEQLAHALQLYRYTARLWWLLREKL